MTATPEPNPADARSWLVTPTRQAVRTVKELNQTLDTHAEQLLASLNARERAAVENSLLLPMKALHEDTAANCCLPPPDARREVMLLNRSITVRKAELELPQREARSIKALYAAQPGAASHGHGGGPGAGPTASRRS